MAEKWEYKVLAVDWNKGNGTWKTVDAISAMEFSTTTLAETFNHMGEAGWELVGFAPYQGKLQSGEAFSFSMGTWEAVHIGAIFKRRKP